MKIKGLHLIVLLVIVICFSLSACNNTQREVTEPTAVPATETPVPSLPAATPETAVAVETPVPEVTPEALEPTPTPFQGPITLKLQYDGADVSALSFQTATVFQLTAVASDGSTGGSWTSSDASAASVDENGVVTCWKAGNPKITYSLGDAAASVSLTITEPTVKICFGGQEKNDITINGAWGFEIDLEALVTPEGTAVTWVSDDSSIASVSDTGHVTAFKMGTTTIRAKCGTAEAVCIVRITAAPPAYMAPTPDINDKTPRIVIVYWGVPNTDFTITVGAKVQMNYILYNVDPGSPVTWSIQDPAFASVDPNGIVTGLRPTAEKDAYAPYTTLIATCGDLRCECIVRVKAADNPA